MSHLRRNHRAALVAWCAIIMLGLGVFGAAPAAAQCRSFGFNFSGNCSAVSIFGGPDATAVGQDARAFGTAATA